MNNAKINLCKYKSIEIAMIMKKYKWENIKRKIDRKKHELMEKTIKNNWYK